MCNKGKNLYVYIKDGYTHTTLMNIMKSVKIMSTSYISIGTTCSKQNITTHINNQYKYKYLRDMRMK